MAAEQQAGNNQPTNRLIDLVTDVYQTFSLYFSLIMVTKTSVSTSKHINYYRQDIEISYYLSLIQVKNHLRQAKI